MALRLPDWATDWKVAFFAAERRLSPRLEQAIRTDVFLDAMTVTYSLSRLAQRSVGGARYSIADALGLPTSRQVAELQRSMDQLVETQQSARAGRDDSTRSS
jgi:hypothetical protein